MTIEYFGTDFISHYKIKGQALEQEYRYYKTGIVVKADNVPAWEGCDIANASIKSARATVCKGTNLTAHLGADKATAFIYLTQTKIAYIMTKAEYKAFVEMFGTITRDSQKNGGAEKIRLKSESTALLAYLAERVSPSPP